VSDAAGFAMAPSSAASATPLLAPVLVGQLVLTPRPTPPSIPLRFIRSQIERLRESAARLDAAHRAAEGTPATIIDASRSLRRSAANRLEQAAHLELPGLVQPLPTADLRLVQLLPALDRLLRSLLEHDLDDGDPRLTLLAGIAERIASTSPRDASTSATIQHAAVVELALHVHNIALPSPWPLRSDHDDEFRHLQFPPPSAIEPLIESTIATMRTLNDEDRTHADAIDAFDLDRLRRAAVDPTRPHLALRRRSTLATLNASLRSIASLRWIDRNDRARLTLLALRTLEWMSDDAIDRVTEAVDGIASTAGLLDSMERLRIADSGRFRRVVVIGRILRRIDDPDLIWPEGDPGEGGTSRTDPRTGKQLLRQLVMRMAETSGEDVRADSPAIAEALRELGRERRRVENVLMTTLDELADRPDAATDPRLAAMFAAQRQLHDDLRRMSAISEWAPRLALGDQERASAIRRQLEKMLRWLRDPNRRPDAERAIRELERQLEAFLELPGESLLAEGSLPALANPRRAQEAINTINAARNAWSSEWSRGHGSGPATATLWRWHRLLTIALAVETIRDEQRRARWMRGAGLRLAAWPDWNVPDRLVVRAAEASVDDLRAALREPDPSTGRRQRGPDPLRRAEHRAALPRLAMVVAELLLLAESGARPAAELSFAALLPAPEDALLESERPALLSLGLAALEHADAEGADADAWAEYLRALSDDLVDRIAPPRRHPPALHGFDGGDPTAVR